MHQWPSLKAVVMLERGIPQRSAKEQQSQGRGRRFSKRGSMKKIKSSVYYVSEFHLWEFQC